MESSNLSNHFLIAMPALMDLHFRHTVSYICEHGADGTIGIIVNRPLNITLSEVFSQINITSTLASVNETPVYYGGPVQPDRGFVIHPHTETVWRSTIATSDEFMITTSQDILEAIACGEGPENFLIALGYAGWSKTQLEHEILENTWLTCEADAAILYNTPAAERWATAAKLLGIDINALSGDVGHA